MPKILQEVCSSSQQVYEVTKIFVDEENEAQSSLGIYSRLGKWWKVDLKLGPWMLQKALSHMILLASWTTLIILMSTCIFPTLH